LRSVVSTGGAGGVRATIAEPFGISQPTVLRTIATLEGPIEAALGEHVRTLEDLPEQSVVVFGGALSAWWSYRDPSQLFSAKHHSLGHKPRVGSDTDGTVAWIFEQLAGSIHDHAARDHHHIDNHVSTDQVVADKGYQRSGAFTGNK